MSKHMVEWIDDIVGYQCTCGISSTSQKFMMAHVADTDTCAKKEAA